MGNLSRYNDVITISKVGVTITDNEETVTEQGYCFMDRWGHIIPEDQARKIITDLETFYDSECDRWIEDNNKEVDEELRIEMNGYKD
jgi:hypothetical protein